MFINHIYKYRQENLINIKNKFIEMAKSKFSFSDIKIGDLVLTSNNQIGEVIALKSYAYLNDKILLEHNNQIFDLHP